MTIQVTPETESALRPQDTPVAATPQVSRFTRYRWLICALLFIAIGINYIDRHMIGILKPTLQADLGWT